MTVTSEFGTCRFGNQLFFYCACRYFAEKLGCKFSFPRSWLGNGLIECDLGAETIGLDAVILKGVFQDKKYVNKDYFKVIYGAHEHSVLEQFDINTHCFIHVRSGDYSGNQCLLPKEYFINAKKHFPPNLKYVVVTEDDYAQSLNIGDHYISSDRNTDFRILTLAKYLVISNSTFSWWAAYLNKNKKICIGPNRFINYNRHMSANDWFPGMINVDEITFID